MKKLMFAIGLGLISGSLYAACMGDTALCYQDGKVTINGVSLFDGNGVTMPVKTTAQINTSTATAVSQTIRCSDCTIPYATCVSTSIGSPGAGSDYILSTGTKCG